MWYVMWRERKRDCQRKWYVMGTERERERERKEELLRKRERERIEDVYENKCWCLIRLLFLLVSHRKFFLQGLVAEWKSRTQKNMTRDEITKKIICKVEKRTKEKKDIMNFVKDTPSQTADFLWKKEN